MQTPQRSDWNGHPVELGDAWIMRKGDKVARCILVTHPFGWGAPLDDNGSAPLAGVSIV